MVLLMRQVTLRVILKSEIYVFLELLEEINLRGEYFTNSTKSMIFARQVLQLFLKDNQVKLYQTFSQWDLSVFHKTLDNNFPI